MLSTLFFDSADATSELHVRTALKDSAGGAPTHTITDPLTSYRVADFPSSGSIPVPPLRATLLWWLDRNAPLVHILVTGSTIGDLSYSCRKLSLEFPSQHHTIIACGVTHIRDQTVFAVSWVTSSLEAGALQFQLQRSSDHHSHLLIVPDEQAVLTSRFSNVSLSFEYDASVVLGRTNDDTNGADGEEVADAGLRLRGSVIASLPPDVVADRVLSVVLLSNGYRLWRVELADNGTFIEKEFQDTNEDNGGSAESARSRVLLSWFSSWSRGDEGRKRQRYLAVSAVQLTHYFTLLRSDGSLQLYDCFLSPVSSSPRCVLARDEMGFGHALQWASLVGDSVHVITSFGGTEVGQCTWAQIPIAQKRGVAAEALKVAILPPSSTGALLGCVAVNSGCLALLWDVGAEGGMCIHFPLSVGSLLHTSGQEFSAILHIVDAQKSVGTSEQSCPASDAHFTIQGTKTFFCHSRPLHALMAVGEEMVLVEKASENVRVHVLTDDLGPLEEMLESAFAITRPVVAKTHSTLPLASVHLIPTVVKEGGHDAIDRVEAFFEGVELAASCAEATDHLSALLINAVHCVPIASTLGGFQLLRSAAHLQGYVPSGFVTEASMIAATEHATTLFDVPSRRLSFCSYSRHFIQHTVARDLLLRVAYLICSFIGWMGSDPDYGTNPIIAGIRMTLELLSAAYHSIGVTGPSTATIVPEVSKTVTDDVIKGFLQFKDGKGRVGTDVLFAVRVASRLRACNEARGPRACATWCNLLSRRYPCLQHFRIIRYLEVGRTSCPSQLAAMCLATTFHLVNCPADIAMAVLFDFGVVTCSDNATQTAFDNISGDEWKVLLNEGSDSEDNNTAFIISGVYRVALLRYIVHSAYSHFASVNASLVRELFFTELVQLEQYVQQSRSDCPGILRALKELQLEVHMFLARAGLDSPNFGDVFHSLEEAQLVAIDIDMKAVCTERIMAIIGDIIEVASSSDELTSNLVDVAHSSAELDGLLTSKWYSFVARLTARSGSTEAEQTRWRAAVGLYRYLCKRHAYGQAARALTDITTAIRSSPLRASAVETVVELTSLAVLAAELIAPTAPLQLKEAGLSDDPQEPSTFSAFSGTGNFYTPEYAAAREPLSREDLPWLRRRHYQACCEMQLLKANRRVDCADLWVENPPAAAYSTALNRFVEALMEARLWTEALRFAAMSGLDVAIVLQNHVLDLLKCTNYTCDEEALDEWVTLVASCEEFSNASNKYSSLRSVVVTALLYSYEKMCPILLNSLIKADRYEALQALLEAFETLLFRNSASEAYDAVRACEVQSHESSALVARGEDGEKDEDAHEPWVLLLRALEIGCDVFMDSLSNEGNRLLDDAPLTAGVFDSMARKAQELLNSPLLLEHPSLVHAEGTARKFLKFAALFTQKKLAAV